MASDQPLPSSADDLNASPAAAPAQPAPAVPAAATGEPAHRRAARAGLCFDVASNLRDVEDAWDLVYTSYRRANLIDPNPLHLHTVPQAVGAHAAVIVGRIGEMSVATLTVIGDSPMGVPLDAVYGPELAELRAQGRRPVEIGLFADRRDQVARSLPALVELMRFCFYFSVHTTATDMIIGVHPHHAGFYCRYFTFEQLGSTRTHPTVKNHPVVLLRTPREILQREPLPKSLEYYRANPLAPSDFEHRFDFSAPALQGSRIQQYLEARAVTQPPTTPLWSTANQAGSRCA